MNNGIVELAILFKERNNKEYMGIQIGKVVSALPDIKISLGDNILLDKSHLVFGASVLNGYKRKYSISGTIQFSETDCGTTDYSGNHRHSISTLDVDTTYTADGDLTLTDTLVVGDEVILIPTEDEQTFFVIDKAVRL